MVVRVINRLSLIFPLVRVPEKKWGMYTNFKLSKTHVVPPIIEHYCIKHDKFLHIKRKLAELIFEINKKTQLLKT